MAPQTFVSINQKKSYFCQVAKTTVMRWRLFLGDFGIHFHFRYHFFCLDLDPTNRKQSTAFQKPHLQIILFYSMATDERQSFRLLRTSPSLQGVHFVPAYEKYRQPKLWTRS